VGCPALEKIGIHNLNSDSDRLFPVQPPDFKREVTQNEAPRLMTLRTRLLVIGAIRGADGRQQILRLGLRGHWRQRFAALLQRIAALAAPKG